MYHDSDGYVTVASDDDEYRQRMHTYAQTLRVCTYSVRIEGSLVADNSGNQRNVAAVRTLQPPTTYIILLYPPTGVVAA